MLCMFDTLAIVLNCISFIRHSNFKEIVEVYALYPLLHTHPLHHMVLVNYVIVVEIFFVLSEHGLLNLFLSVQHQDRNNKIIKCS